MAGPGTVTAKRLFAVSGNRCAFPKCTNQLVDASGTLTGEICHICASSKGGPRHDPTQTESERHDFRNLLLLCPIHHVVVDHDSVAYPADRLFEMKRRHEATATPVPEPSDTVARQLVASAAASGQGSVVVMSQNQSGGITAGTVNINATTTPTLDRRGLFLNKAVDGGYHTRVELIVSNGPAGNLYIRVDAPSIRRIDLVPQRPGIVLMGNCGTRPGFAFANLQQPYGRIFLEIFTEQPEKPEIQWDLQ